MQLPCARQWAFAVARQSSFMVAQADGGVCLCSRPAVCIVVAHLVWMTRMKVGSSYCTLVNHVSWEPSRMTWIFT